jgi:hypothetical protein
MTSHSLSQAPGMARAHRGTKSILLGGLSIAPAAAFVGALIAWVLLFIRIKHAVDSPFAAEPPTLDAGLSLFTVLVIVAALTSIAAVVALLVDVFTNPAVPGDRQLMWVLVLLFANVVAFPVYWYVVHWRAPALSAAS